LNARAVWTDTAAFEQATNYAERATTNEDRRRT
jgi:hypothetical protein